MDNIQQKKEIEIENRKAKFFHVCSFGLWIIAGLFILCLLFYAGFSAFDGQKITMAIWYDLLVLLPLLVIGILATMKQRHQQQSGKTILFTWLTLGAVLIITVWLSNYKSLDWKQFLQVWCKDYQSMSWQESLRQITTVSDYVPFYNYFLICFSHWFSMQGCLYAIKYLTFIFSIVLAMVIELIVCHVRKTKFSYGHLTLFLLLPPVLLEFGAWAQCDVIYTSFALLAFYFALKHRSVPCFISLGLAFAIKLQFLFIVPIIFVMLIIRDQDGKKYLSWQWIWLAPCMYVVNLLPVIVGADLSKLLLVYFSQAGKYHVFSMSCLNLPFLFNWLVCFCNDTTFSMITLLMAAVGITITIALLILVLRAHHRQCLTQVDLVRYALCFAMVMVYFMPKMHERFYFVAFALGIVWCLVQPNAWHTLISTMITVGLTCSFFIYLFFYLVSIETCFGIVILCYTVGWLLLTFALLGLLIPLIKAEIHARKFDEKKQLR